MKVIASAVKALIKDPPKKGQLPNFLRRRHEHAAQYELPGQNSPLLLNVKWAWPCSVAMAMQSNLGFHYSN